MCSIDAHDKYHTSYVDDGSSGGDNVLQSNSTTQSLVSLSATINFIDCWLKFLEIVSLERSNMYFETMECMFQKISVELTKPLSLKEIRKKYYMLLELNDT